MNWRYLAGGGAGLMLVAAGMMLQAVRPRPAQVLAAMPAAAAATGNGQSINSPEVPEALPATREQKRFSRYDKDRNGAITRDEYLAARKKAYAKLDVDGNGTLTFDEWATKAETKFATADKDKSGTMNATEFATTAVKRKSRPARVCPPGKSGASDETGDGDA